jgi:hypothetical protein
MGERHAGDAERIMRAHWRTHELLKVLPAVASRQTIVQKVALTDKLDVMVKTFDRQGSSCESD